VPDWIGTDGASTAARYRTMAERELHGVSPSYEAICVGVAADRQALALLDALPAAKRQPNLLLAAVRFAGGPVDSWPAFREFLLDRSADVTATMAARSTQTNEPRRCATLLPALAALPQPLALLEAGASAGLCLYPDQYAYRYGDHLLGRSPVRLDCTVTGRTPVPEELPRVVWRAGLDLNPLDVADEDDVHWLESLIWPEQHDRFARLHAAVDIARADPAVIVQGDLTADLAAVASDAPGDATLVVFHSAVLAYVDAASRAAFVGSVRELAATRPTVWLSNEGPGVVTGTEVDTAGRSLFVLAQDGRPLALTGPHGQTLHWLA
jgi:hypothetical protein